MGFLNFLARKPGDGWMAKGQPSRSASQANHPSSAPSTVIHSQHIKRGSRYAVGTRQSSISSGLQSSIDHAPSASPSRPGTSTRFEEEPTSEPLSSVSPQRQSTGSALDHQKRGPPYLIKGFIRNEDPATDRCVTSLSVRLSTHVDILDAQSELRPSSFQARLRATGARDYGEDVADRNIIVNGVNLTSPAVQQYYHRQHAGPGILSQPAPSATKQAASYGRDEDDKSSVNQEIEEEIDPQPIPARNPARKPGLKAYNTDQKRVGRLMRPVSTPLNHRKAAVSRRFPVRSHRAAPNSYSSADEADQSDTPPFKMRSQRRKNERTNKGHSSPMPIRVAYQSTSLDPHPSLFEAGAASPPQVPRHRSACKTATEYDRPPTQTLSASTRKSSMSQTKESTRGSRNAPRSASSGSELHLDHITTSTMNALQSYSREFIQRFQAYGGSSDEETQVDVYPVSRPASSKEIQHVRKSQSYSSLDSPTHLRNRSNGKSTPSLKAMLEEIQERQITVPALAGPAYDSVSTPTASTSLDELSNSGLRPTSGHTANTSLDLSYTGQSVGAGLGGDKARAHGAAQDDLDAFGRGDMRKDLEQSDLAIDDNLSDITDDSLADSFIEGRKGRRLDGEDLLFDDSIFTGHGDVLPGIPNPSHGDSAELFNWSGPAVLPGLGATPRWSKPPSLNSSQPSLRASSIRSGALHQSCLSDGLSDVEETTDTSTIYTSLPAPGRRAKPAAINTQILAPQSCVPPTPEKPKIDISSAMKLRKDAKRQARLEGKGETRDLLRGRTLGRMAS
ncbi:hypothetical protein B0I35DRAFT_169015 [Stachybotrys elegans]|uniref:Uncharacterized protein n=1 Tax=Stachybotrys elegans TaxID=80388 RepID=A0A8K0WTZ0_9HYPO|nr:hypothetical protein B0I35DRAFT_169015 [Stachybotrys elegans]